MNSAAHTTRTLEIDGMSSSACVHRVTNVLRNICGLSTMSVTVGFATIHADRGGCAAACRSIGRTGFRAHERAWRGQANDSTYAASRAFSGQAVLCATV